MQASKWMGACAMALGAGFVCAQGVWRFLEQSKIEKLQTRTGTLLLKSYDLRGVDRVMQVILDRESDDFKDRIRQKQKPINYWPGLRATQVSWVWMQTLNGLHTASSFEGDYSWLFSKLNFLSSSDPAGGDFRAISLAPFFLVIGHDGIGSTLLVRDWIMKYPNYWKTWFYAGYHAAENLKAPNLASDYYERTSHFKEAPDFVAALAIRLRADGQIEDKKNRDLLLRDLDPELTERLRRVRPEWFEF